jgi:hypothetical protein
MLRHIHCAAVGQTAVCNSVSDDQTREFAVHLSIISMTARFPDNRR